MPRLSDDQINELKRSASLVEYATGQGHALKQKGDEYALCCPFHDDKTPSCYINPEKNLFYCHGCSEKGDVIEWVMKTESLTFRDACDRLQPKTASSQPAAYFGAS